MPESTARIVGVDFVSGGPGWYGKFGGAGYWFRSQSGSTFVDHKVMPANVPAMNVYKVNSTSPPSNYTFPGDLSWLPLLPDGANRTGSVWYDNDGLNVSLTTTDDEPMLMSMFLGDDSQYRRGRCEIHNAAQTQKLDELSITQPYPEIGAWIRLAFQSSIICKLIPTGGQNMFLSGITLDRFSGQVGSYIV